MRQLLLLVLLILAQNAVLAQKYFPFDTIGTSWNELKEYGSGKSDIEKWIESYFVSGDTLIKSIKYFKIYRKTDTGTHYIGCFKEKDKVVTYIGDDYWGFDTDTSIVLYDFTKGIDIEFRTGVWHNNRITAIDSILILDKYRKRYTMNNGEKWIEGIGSTFGFLYPMTNIPTKTYWHSELACFKRGEDVIYLNPNFSDCTTQVNQSISEPSSESLIKIYPNPANRKNEIVVESEKVSFSKIQVFNISGQLLKTYSYGNAHQVKIITTDYSADIYILKIFDSNGKVDSKKLIIE